MYKLLIVDDEPIIRKGILTLVNLEELNIITIFLLKRIKLYYGEEYGLEIKSQIGVGTTVYIRIGKLSQERYL